MMSTYKLVSTTMTAKSLMHENDDRSICPRYKKKLKSTSDVFQQSFAVMAKDLSSNKKHMNSYKEICKKGLRKTLARKDKILKFFHGDSHLSF